MEQSALFNSANLALDVLAAANTTVANAGVSTLWCPSDPDASTLYEFFVNPLYMRLSSYAPNMGLWPWDLIQPCDATYGSSYPAASASRYGPISYSSAVRLAGIIDGTSNTILFDEVNVGFDIAIPFGFAYGSVSAWSIHEFMGSSLFAPNSYWGADLNSPAFFRAIYSVGSKHPGGANLAFCDGSVRFLKDSINSWPINSTTGFPTGLDFISHPYYALGTARPGVFQALSTRNGGEVISADAY
jgi:prepilin-type processing-associated H-X9-DG protein